MADVTLPASRHFALHELGAGVYAAIATDGGWAVCNAGIIDLGDRTIIFDTLVNQSAASELKTAAEGLTGKPVTHVINSHWHSDHIKGNQVFSGANIISTRKTKEVMAQIKKRYETEREKIREDVQKNLDSVLANPNNPDRVLDEGYDRGHLEGLTTFRYTLPEVTFEDSMMLHGSRRTSEVVTYGGGHTVSDSLLYVPEPRTAFLGDLLFIDYQPYLVDGDPEKLLLILDKIEALDALKLIPGHGPVGTPRDIAPIREYVLGLEKTVEEVKASGGGLEEAVKRPIAPRFKDWMWRRFYRDNLEFLFQRKTV